MLKKIFSAAWCFALIPVCLYASSMRIHSASELDYPPYCIVTEGRADGFSVELLRSALKAMNTDVAFYVDAWSVIKRDLEIGKIDVLPLVGRTPEREAVFDFSVPYLVMHGAIVVREGTKTIERFEDLEGKEVMVMRDDNAHEFLMRSGLNMRIVPVPSYEEALKMLSSGAHDAVVVQKLVGSQLIRSFKLNNLSIVPQLIEGFRQDFSFAVTEGNKELLARLNEGLSIVMTNGEYQRLYQKWLTPLEFEAQQKEKVIQVLAVTVVLLLCMILITGVWQRSLKRQVALKTQALLSTQEQLRELNASLESRIRDAIHQIHDKDNLMISQSRQAAMGEMIAMIAHQWRQPISVIAMIANNLALDAELAEEIRSEALLKVVADISEQTTHLSQTIDDFRNFFKPNKEKQTLYLKEVVDGALHIIGTSLQSHAIEIIMHEEARCLVEVYRNELIQVLINLMNNAKDALIVGRKEGACITIRLYQGSDNEACIDVADNGGGISKAVMAKLGEPYVSTKSSNGTGLGVYMSKVIVEKHLGGILKWKNSDEGAIFTICLPTLGV